VHKSSRPTPFRARTILCVDDESGALSIRKALLEQAGYEVLTAANAAQAFEIFQSNTIDLVVSDHLLPDAPGAAMAGQMKMAKPGIPILLFSGVVDPPEGAEHADKFLGKTAGPEALLQTVAELLRYRRLRINLGTYFAEISCDTLADASIWHYVVQQTGSSEILVWSQDTTEEAAIADAWEALRSFNIENLAKGS